MTTNRTPFFGSRGEAVNLFSITDVLRYKMAHFFAEVGGDNLRVIKQPNGLVGITGVSSGMSCHLRGWNIGARIIIFHQDGKDIVKILRTQGSNGVREELIEILEVDEEDLGE